MFKQFIQKPTDQQENARKGSLTMADLKPRIAIHYGIPSTASILAFDSNQSLLAVGTLDGRIKVIGSDNIEGLLVSPKPLPFKNLEFLQNQGFLASISSENEIQVWDLENRGLASALQWESNITAFSVIYGTSYMYIGSEHGDVTVLKYQADDRKIIQLPYYIPANVLSDEDGMPLPDQLPVVGVLHQPCSPGNRILIAYENGLIILWDASEDQIVFVRGSKNLNLKYKTVLNCVQGTKHMLHDNFNDNETEKEISSLCWASENGSVLAVGYVDGDIMFWDISSYISSKDRQAEDPVDDVVKLQLASGNRRLPVIVLHWCATRSSNDRAGQLFVYGGDQIGSDEVLTILSLEWSQGIQSLKCVSRVDLSLHGSFADMVLLRTAGVIDSNSNETLLLTLTNPGQLHVYDKASLFTSTSQLKNTSVRPVPVKYTTVVPTTEPDMTVSKLSAVHGDGEFSQAFSRISAEKLSVEHLRKGSTEWPLTGGLPSQGFDAQTYQVERVYISGYQDGSVRLWDATYPSLQLIHSIQPEVKGMTNEIVSVTALDFCSSTLKLSVGDECGRVRLYDLIRIPFEKNLHFVTAAGKEVHNFQQGDVPYCLAVFSILSSPICTLRFSNSGNQLFVGFNCGQVAMLDINTLSVISLTDVSSETSSPVKVLDVRSFLDANSSVQSPKGSQSKIPSDSESGVLFTMTMNAHISVRDITTGNPVCSQPLQPIKNCTAISLHVIDGDLISEVGSGKHSSKSPESSKAIDELSQVGLKHSPRSGHFDRRLMNLLILLCCEDSLHLYSLNSMIEGDNNSIHKVDLVKPCCWTTTLKKDEKECGLVVLYQTGVIEIRSLPDLEVLGESSLMSILRWNYKTNMDKTMCSTDQGEIALVNGHELAFISVLSYENDLRIPDSLPCLYNKVLAASVDATLNFSPTQKQAVTPGILGGIMKGLKAEKVEHNADHSGLHKNIHAHLETLFSSPPFLKPSIALTDDQEIIQLNLDDIVIDEPLHVSSSSQENKNETKDKETERDRLFHGGDSDIKPKLRTAEEIRAKYRKNEDASGAAAQARDKLVQRQEKLEKLGQHTEELKIGAEDFASMAKQLAKSMENRKWWQI
ncbi:hypothetical protein CsatA_018423 [Cannabis sativa]